MCYQVYNYKYVRECIFVKEGQVSGAMIVW